MAKNRAVWGINLGQSALKAVKLRYAEASGQVVAVAFDYIEHPKILGQPDADPEALIREALQTFLSRNEVKGDTICISVPGQTGLARFVKLPPVDPKKVPDIVRFEARQQIPFPLEEVVWSYQKIGAPAGDDEFAETEVGLFAMKRDVVFKHLRPFLEAGLEVEVVQMSPLALYNFFTYDYLSQKPAAGAEESEEDREEIAPGAAARKESYVIVEIGTDNTDLVITDGQRIWLRNIPIGGNHFTRALTKELKLTFAKAEHLKRNATKAKDPRTIFQAMRQTFNDFVGEVQRSIGYFSSVNRNSRVTTIVGLGNAFKLPGLQKFLSQNLQYEVIKLSEFKQLAGDAVVNGPAFQENLLSFGVAYGLALQGLGLTPIHSSLLPREIEMARMIERKKPWGLTAAACLMVAFSSLFIASWRPYNSVAPGKWAPATAEAKTQTDAAKKLDQEYGAARGLWAKSNETGKTLVANVEARLFWPELFKAINDCVPHDDSGEKDASRRKELNITAITTDYKDLVGWLKTIKPQYQQSYIDKVDQGKPLSGPGWVVRLQGYHLFYDLNQPQELFGENFVNTMFLKKLKGEDPRWIGISHAVISEVAGPNPFMPGIAPVNQPQPGRQPPGPRNPAAAVMPALQPRDAAGGGLRRTDFVIELVWRPMPVKQRQNKMDLRALVGGPAAATAAPAKAGPPQR